MKLADSILSVGEATTAAAGLERRAEALVVLTKALDLFKSGMSKISRAIAS